MEAEVHVMENELKTKLENDIYQLSIREMNKLLKRAQDYSLRFERGYSYYELELKGAIYSHKILLSEDSM